MDPFNFMTVSLPKLGQRVYANHIDLNDIHQGGSQKRTRASRGDTAATPTPYADLGRALSSHVTAPRASTGTDVRVTVSEIYLA